jgi:hypothetical protein
MFLELPLGRLDKQGELIAEHLVPVLVMFQWPFVFVPTAEFYTAQSDSTGKSFF